MTYRIPLTPEDAKVLEWESLVGEVGYAGGDLKRHVEAREYDEFFVDVTNLRVTIDELDRRMRAERDAANLESLSHRG